VRWLEVRRHSFTKKGDARGRGSDLSQAGVAAARDLGKELGTVDYVVVSTEPRTMETAVAMGFAADDIVEMGTGYCSTEVVHHDQWEWDRPYVRYRELLEAGGAVVSAAGRQLEVWRGALAHVSEGGLALIVSHGGLIEPTLVAAFPQADHELWGEPFSPLDGARLAYEMPTFVSTEFQRYRP
jgi:broad specificity phosphatase PhoE